MKHLIFDFERFSKIAAGVYEEDNPYSLDECLGVFRYYFLFYELYMNRPHPPIRQEQIARIMRAMPFAYPDKSECHIVDFFPAVYPYLIALHFKTRYRRCDYNINHFFSERIRELRMHESDAGYE